MVWCRTDCRGAGTRREEAGLRIAVFHFSRTELATYTLQEVYKKKKKTQRKLYFFDVVSHGIIINFALRKLKLKTEKRVFHFYNL